MVKFAVVFWDNIALISVITSLCTMAAFLISPQFRLADERRLWHLAQLGFLGGSFPWGFLFIAAAINPDLIDKLRNIHLFSQALTIFGFVYMVYVGGKIVEKFKK